MVGQALAKGELVQVADPAPSTICDALQPNVTKQLNLDLLAWRAEPGVTVSDDDVRAAQRFAFAPFRILVKRTSLYLSRAFCNTARTRS